VLTDQLYIIDKVLDQLSTQAMAPGPSQGLPHAEWEQTGTDFSAIRSAWNEAIFSGAADRSLKRYFQFQLEGVRERMDTLRCMMNSSGCELHSTRLMSLSSGMVSLLDYLKTYFYRYLDFDIPAPVMYHQLVLESFPARIWSLRRMMENARFSEPLKNCLKDWLDQLLCEAGYAMFSLRALFYLDELLSQLLNIFEGSLDLTDRLNLTLVRIDFNYLGYFTYRQQLVNARLSPLSHDDQLQALVYEARQIELMPVSANRYDPSLPSLGILLAKWIKEQMAIRTATTGNRKSFANQGSYDKLPLNFSVVQLACFIFVFFETESFGTVTLTEIFKFVSKHYSSKRRQVISQGSLSKQYYTIDQFTASAVKDKLQKMVQLINRKFFPVWVAVMIIIHAR
jgi:hypothetical protein